MKFFKINNKVVGEGNGQLPKQSEGIAAGYDLISTECFTLYTNQRYMFSTGIGCILPKGTVGKLEPRSKLANKFGIMVLAGTIEEDYRGEIKVILFNSGEDPFYVSEGDSIVQMLVDENKYRDAPEWTNEVEETVRGQAGIDCDDLRL